MGRLFTREIKREAVGILDGVGVIAEAEMMVPGKYLTSNPVEPAREGELCRGYQACAVGSLWLAGGVEIREDYCGGNYLPGTDGAERERFLLGIAPYDDQPARPALALAYAALNKSAELTATEQGWHLAREYMPSYAEAAFEAFAIGPRRARERILACLPLAKELVEAVSM